MDQLVFSVGDYGSTFATRERATTVGRDLIAALRPSYSAVVLDFRDVRIVSYSFADQLMRAVVQALDRPHIREARFLGCNDETLEIFQEILAKRNQLGPSKLSVSSEGKRITIVRGAA